MRIEILQANQRDIEAAPGYGLTEAQVDRLKLTADRIDGIAQGLGEIAALPDPIGETIESTVRPNGLEVAKLSCAVGSRVLHLRVAAQCDGRRGGHLSQERQRGDPARRQRGAPFKSSDRGRAARCGQPGGSSCRCDPTW